VKITEIAQTVKDVYSFSQEMDWATFWAAFSQTHLVTLVFNHNVLNFNGTQETLRDQPLLGANLRCKNRGRCYDHHFRRLFPFSAKKIGVLLENQC
jgi:hypothetical protein